MASAPRWHAAGYTPSGRGLVDVISATAQKTSTITTISQPIEAARRAPEPGAPAARAGVSRKRCQAAKPNKAPTSAILVSVRDHLVS